MDDTHAAAFETEWRPRLVLVGAQDADWPWRDDLYAFSGDPSWEMLCLVDEMERLHGMMSVQLGGPVARLAPGESCAYVARLAVAPWNRPTAKPNRELLGCGTLLLSRAVRDASKRGTGGRVGLHSLEDVDTHAFYRKIGMTEIGRDGPDEDNLLYFEFTEEQAMAFLNKIS